MKLSKVFTLLLALTCVCTFWVSPMPFEAGKTAHAASQKTVLSGKININTASMEQLEMLPRIGTKTAQSIIEYRTQNGPFKMVETLANVKGIGEKTIKELGSYIVLEGDTTLKIE